MKDELCVLSGIQMSEQARQLAVWVKAARENGLIVEVTKDGTIVARTPSLPVGIRRIVLAAMRHHRASMKETQCSGEIANGGRDYGLREAEQELMDARVALDDVLDEELGCWLVERPPEHDELHLDKYLRGEPLDTHARTP